MNALEREIRSLIEQEARLSRAWLCLAIRNMATTTAPLGVAGDSLPRQKYRLFGELIVWCARWR
jgi:hypothetical protein